MPSIHADRRQALQRFHRAFSPFEHLSVIVAQELRAGVKRPSDRKALEKNVLRVFERASRTITPSPDAWHRSGDLLSDMAKQERLTRPSEGAQFVSAQPDLWEDDALIEQAGYMTDLITRRTVEFINQNATRPFFIDVAFNAPHSPTQRPENPERTSVTGSATRADYAAVMERVDRGVGEILEALRRRGLEQKTIVIFTNDNGGVGLSHSAPLFHRKFSAWEGGIRVPALIRWPGRIPAGN